jgi:uncharacterized protein (UPF0276 family)
MMRARSGNLPVSAGIGLRAPHYDEVIEHRPDVGFLEVHSENYFGAGGAPLEILHHLRADYPLSLHGVGLSLGSADALSNTHLARLRSLIAQYEPFAVSEHLCWSSINATHLNDLLPLPYTDEALAHVCARIDEAQARLGFTMLIENVSSYLRFSHSTIPEWEFLAEVSRRTDCGILLDVNNVYVSARNHGFDPETYIDAIPAEAVGEIHLAGHTVRRFDEGELLIDTHDALVSEPVWSLYRHTIERMGPKPTLIEWDTNLPPLHVLVNEAAQADRILRETNISWDENESRRTANALRA